MAVGFPGNHCRPMNPSDQIQKKLPLWVFFATDVALLGTAALIAKRSAQPLSTQAALLVVLCVIAGAIVALVPLIAHYERQKNETLDERQRALEALARTVSASAEQISIAAGGLHEIAEIAQKNLRHAEQLPHRLQDKIAEFQSQLTSANDTEKEELEKELVALRTTESERLESISDKISKATAEWAKLEAATRQNLTAANEALSKLALGTANAIGKAQAAAEQALLQARTEAGRVVGEAAGHATRAIESARASASADLDAKLASATSGLADRLARDIAAQVAPQLAALSRPNAPGETAGGTLNTPEPIRFAPVESHSARENGTLHSSDSPPVPADPSQAAEPPPPAVRRARKPRREESIPAAAEINAPAAPEADASLKLEPQPVPSDRIAEVVPVAPHTAEPFPEHLTEGASIGSRAAVAVAPASSNEGAPPARKRPPKQIAVEADAEPALDLGADESHVQNGGVIERVLTSDGATRLLATAYIGIGNRLFIRGEGPGLSWEKGVPLQFVSIGKWRWETNDATGPVRFKLFKNDEAECAALGDQSLDAGHQQEVTATF